MLSVTSDTSPSRSVAAGACSSDGAETITAAARSTPESFDLLTRLRLLCACYPGFTAVRGRGYLRISRQDGEGFEIKVYDLARPPVVILGPWCGELAEDAAVLSLVRKALSGAVRIRIESCRGRDHSWTAEASNRDGSWSAISQNRIVELWPLRATTTRYLTMPSSPTLIREKAVAQAEYGLEAEWQKFQGSHRLPKKPPPPRARRSPLLLEAKCQRGVLARSRNDRQEPSWQQRRSDHPSMFHGFFINMRPNGRASWSTISSAYACAWRVSIWTRNLLHGWVNLVRRVHRRDLLGCMADD